ncbi:MAG: hypothetical protein M1587_00900 [Thaumarchaeota archaeon]|nr:hypothetical protein [Nitrososphaerota archaeon]
MKKPKQFPVKLCSRLSWEALYGGGAVGNQSRMLHREIIESAFLMLNIDL